MSYISRSRTPSPSPSLGTINLSTVHLKPRSRITTSSPSVTESISSTLLLQTPSTPVGTILASPANPLASSRVSDPGGVISSAIRPTLSTSSQNSSRHSSPATSVRRESGSGGTFDSVARRGSGIGNLDSDAFLKTHSSLSSTMHARSRSNSDDSRQHPGPLISSTARPPRPSTSSGPSSAAASPAVRTPLLVTPTATPSTNADRMAGGGGGGGGAMRVSLSLNSDPRPVAHSGKRLSSSSRSSSNYYISSSTSLRMRSKSNEDEIDDTDYNPSDQEHEKGENEVEEDDDEKEARYVDNNNNNEEEGECIENRQKDGQDVDEETNYDAGSSILPSEVSTYLLESAAKRAQAAEERRRSVHQFMAQQKRERRQRSSSLQIIAAEEEAKRKRALSALREEQKIQVQKSLPKSPHHDEDGGATGAFARERLFKSKLVDVGNDDDAEEDDEREEEVLEEEMKVVNLKPVRQAGLKIDPKLASSPYSKPIKGGTVATRKTTSHIQSPRGRTTLRLPEKAERLARIANVEEDSDDDAVIDNNKEGGGMSMGDVALLLLERKKGDEESTFQHISESRSDRREVVFSPESAREQVAQLELLKEQMTDLRNQLASLSVATQLFGTTNSTRQQVQLPYDEQQQQEQEHQENNNVHNENKERKEINSKTDVTLTTTNRSQVSNTHHAPTSPNTLKNTTTVSTTGYNFENEAIDIVPHPSTYIGLSSQESMNVMLTHFKDAVDKVRVPIPQTATPDFDFETDTRNPSITASAYTDIERIMDAAKFGISPSSEMISATSASSVNVVESKRVGTAAVAALAANDPILALLLDAVFDETDEHSLVNAAAARMSAIAMHTKDKEIEDERKKRAEEAAALDALLQEKKPKVEDMEIQTDASTLVITYLGDAQTLIHHANPPTSNLSSSSSSLSSFFSNVLHGEPARIHTVESTAASKDNVNEYNRQVSSITSSVVNKSNTVSNMRLSPDELYHRMIASMDALSAAEEGVAALSALQAAQAEAAAQRQTLAVAAQWQQQSEAAAIAAQLAEIADETNRALEMRANAQQLDLQNLYKEHAIQQAEAASDLIKQLATQAMAQPQLAQYPTMIGVPTLATSRSFTGGAGSNSADRQQNMMFRPPPPATVSEASYGDYTDEFESEEERTFHEERSRSVHEERSMSSLPVSGRVMTGGSLNNLVSPRSSLAVPQVDAIPEDAEEEDIVEEDGVTETQSLPQFNTRSHHPLTTDDDEPDGDDGISEDSVLIREAEDEAVAARMKNAEVERQASIKRANDISNAAAHSLKIDKALVGSTKVSTSISQKTVLKSPPRNPPSEISTIILSGKNSAPTFAAATFIDDSLDGEAAVAALLYDEQTGNGATSALSSAPESLNVSMDMSNQNLLKRFAADLYSRIKNDHALADLRERALFKASSTELKLINKKIEEVKVKIALVADQGSLESETVRKKAKKELISLLAVQKRVVVKHKVKKAEINRTKAESKVRIYNEMLSIQSDMLKLTRLQFAEGSAGGSSAQTAATSLENSLTNDETNFLDASATSNEAALLATEFPGLFPATSGKAIVARGANSLGKQPALSSLISGVPGGAEEALDFLTQALVAWRDRSSGGSSIPSSSAIERFVGGGTQDSIIIPTRPLPTTITSGTAQVPIIYTEAPPESTLSSNEIGSPKSSSSPSLTSLKATRAPLRSPLLGIVSPSTIASISTPTINKAVAKTVTIISGPLESEEVVAAVDEEEYEDSFASDSQGSGRTPNAQPSSTVEAIAIPSSIKKDNRVDSPEAAEVIEEEDMLSSAGSSTPTAIADAVITTQEQDASQVTTQMTSSSQILKTLNVDTSSITFQTVAVRISVHDGPFTSFDSSIDLENSSPQVKIAHSSAFKAPITGASIASTVMSPTFSAISSSSAAADTVDPLSESIGSEELAVLSRPLVVQLSNPSVSISAPKATAAAKANTISPSSRSRSPQDLVLSTASLIASPVSPYGKDDLFIASVGRSANLVSTVVVSSSSTGTATSNSPISASFDDEEEEEEEDLYDFVGSAPGISPPGSFSNNSFTNGIGLAPRPSAPIGGASASSNVAVAGPHGSTLSSSGMQSATVGRSYTLPQPALPSPSQVWERDAFNYLDELLATDDGPAGLLGLSIDRFYSINEEGIEVETLQLVPVTGIDELTHASRLPLSIYLHVERARENLGQTPQDARSAEEMQIRHKLIFDAINEELPRAISKNKHAAGHLRALALESIPVTIPINIHLSSSSSSNMSPKAQVSRIGGSLSNFLSSSTLRMAEDLILRIKKHIKASLSLLSIAVEPPYLLDPIKSAQRVDEVVRSELYLQGDEAFSELFQRISSSSPNEFSDDNETRPNDEQVDDNDDYNDLPPPTQLEDIIASELADELLEEAIDEVLGRVPVLNNEATVTSTADVVIHSTMKPVDVEDLDNYDEEEEIEEDLY